MEITVWNNTHLSPAQTSKFSVTSYICLCVCQKIDKFSWGKESGIKASQALSFSTRKLACVYMQQEKTWQGTKVLQPNSNKSNKSCQEKILSNFAYSRKNKACQGKLVKENLFVIQKVSELVKKLMKGKLAHHIHLSKKQYFDNGYKVWSVYELINYNWVQTEEMISMFSLTLKKLFLKYREVP